MKVTPSPSVEPSRQRNCPAPVPVSYPTALVIWPGPELLWGSRPGGPLQTEGVLQRVPRLGQIPLQVRLSFLSGTKLQPANPTLAHVGTV